MDRLLIYAGNRSQVVVCLVEMTGRAKKYLLIIVRRMDM